MNLKKINLITVIFLVLISFLWAEICLAGPLTQILSGFSKTGLAAGYQPKGTEPAQDFTTAWATYISNFAAGCGGAFFMVLVIYGGWLWMSAQGKEEQVERAKKVIIGAVIGLALIIGARLIAELAIHYLGQTVVIG